MKYLSYQGRKYRNRITKKESTVLDKLIDNKITLNKKFISTIYRETQTAFNEIVPVPPTEIYNFNKFNIKKRHASKILTLKDLADTIQDFVDSNWDTNKQNIMLHSSGFDSRIVSHFIRKTYLKKGGKIKFICLAPEIDLFYPIIKYEGWDEENILTFDIFSDKTTFDFKPLWEQVNGVSSFPQNFIYYIIKNFIDDIDNTNMWAGIFFNEAFQLKGSFENFLTSMYYHRHFTYLCPIEKKPNFLLPMLNLDSLRLIFESKLNKHNRFNLLQYLDPKLAEIPAITNADRLKYYNLPPDLFEPIIKDFKQSFYYRKIDNDVRLKPTIIKNEAMWTKITLASFIDHLLERGVNISY